MIPNIFWQVLEQHRVVTRYHALKKAASSWRFMLFINAAPDMQGLQHTHWVTCCTSLVSWTAHPLNEWLLCHCYQPGELDNTATDCYTSLAKGHHIHWMTDCCTSLVSWTMHPLDIWFCTSPVSWTTQPLNIWLLHKSDKGTTHPLSDWLWHQSSDLDNTSTGWLIVARAREAGQHMPIALIDCDTGMW